jgi:hypothetical protein
MKDRAVVTAFQDGGRLQTTIRPTVNPGDGRIIRWLYELTGRDEASRTSRATTGSSPTPIQVVHALLAQAVGLNGPTRQ